MNQQSYPTPLNEDHLSLRELLDRYWQHKWLYVLVVAACAGAALCYLWIKTPLYSIQASIAIKDEKKGEATGLTLQDLDFLDEHKIVDNEAEIIKSQNLISDVVKKNQLNVSCKTTHLKRTSLLEFPIIHLTKEYTDPNDLQFNISVIDSIEYELLYEKKRNRYVFGDTVTVGTAEFVASYFPDINSKKVGALTVSIISTAKQTENIRSALSVMPPGKNSSVLHLRLLHPSPAKGEFILKSVLSAYMARNSSEKSAQTDTILSLIEERLSIVTRQMQEYETQAEKFKYAKGITQLTDDSRMYLERAKENDKLLAEVTLRLEIVRAMERAVKNAQSVVAPPQGVITDPVLLSMINEMTQLEIEKENLVKTTGPQNPAIATKNSQILSLRRAVLENLEMQGAGLQQTLSVLQAGKKSIDGMISRLPSNERQLTDIFREKNIRESVYIYLLQKREEASLGNAAAFSKMRVIDEPYHSALPVKPVKSVTLLLSLLVGLILSTIIVNLHHSLRRKIGTRTDITRNTGKLPLGEIPLLKPFASNLLHEGNEGAIQQLQKLKARLLKIKNGNSETGVYQICTINGNEGASFVALNLAIAMAQSGCDTLLIDCTGRLRDQLYDAAENQEDSIPKQTTHQHLTYVPFEPGNMVNLPAFIELKKTSFRQIVLLSTPLKTSSLPFEAEQACTVTLVVVRHKYTRMEDLKWLAAKQAGGDLGNYELVYNSIPAKLL